MLVPIIGVYPVTSKILMRTTIQHIVPRNSSERHSSQAAPPSRPWTTPRTSPMIPPSRAGTCAVRHGCLKNWPLPINKPILRSGDRSGKHGRPTRRNSSKHHTPAVLVQYNIGHRSLTICCPSFSCWSRWCCRTESRRSITAESSAPTAWNSNASLNFWSRAQSQWRGQMLRTISRN
jgi:hypothetical protein